MHDGFLYLVGGLSNSVTGDSSLGEALKVLTFDE